ncbi:MAG: hypothetical protein COA80_15615 [Leeuwenhoekiella sp.]|nr:MAG: hypothetical protein COA80_15615 [Leeuwenhoekiella sp.]
MNYLGAISFYAKKHLDFLVSEYDYRIEERSIAYERTLSFIGKNVKIDFIFEMSSLTLPLFFYRAYGMNFDLNKLDYSQKLDKLITQNNSRVIPLQKTIVSEFLKTNNYDQLSYDKEFGDHVKPEIEAFFIQIEKILKENPKIIKGNFLPFLFK